VKLSLVVSQPTPRLATHFAEFSVQSSYSMLSIPPSASAYCITFQSRVSPLFGICHVLSLSLLSQCVVFTPTLWNFTMLKPRSLHNLLSSSNSVSITHAYVLLLYYVSMPYIFASLHASCLFLSFIHDYCRFCLSIHFWV
jgi:hypothetical protein